MLTASSPSLVVEKSGGVEDVVETVAVAEIARRKRTLRWNWVVEGREGGRSVVEGEKHEHDDEDDSAIIIVFEI